MVEQQQKAQAERIAQQAALVSGGRAVMEDRPKQYSTWAHNKGQTGTPRDAPPAPIPFHWALFQTPSELALANQGSSDEAPVRDARKGKAPRAEPSPERVNRQFSEAILQDPLPKHYAPISIREYSGATDPDDHLGCSQEKANGLTISFGPSDLEGVEVSHDDALIIRAEDQEKVSFITTDDIYCYNMMPFGLKNAGAMYQRLMNKVFRMQIRRNLEVYIDGILIKSLRAADLCADIEETFRTLRAYEVKLNLQKCMFGAKGGRFLGYIVIERGIEANPSKVKALQDMPPPRNLKEVQRLTAKPIIGEPLRVYLSSTEHAVGSALVRSDGEEQPVYFLSHILKDVESRYTDLEKLVFALVLAARRLRPYFLAHTIIVMTNSPLGRVLLNPEASERLIKWTTELSEFDIQYQPRTAIKAQSLADFVTEVKNPEHEATWKVYVDGSSTRQGSGVGVLLVSPHGERMHLSIRLNYRATNNEAEYELVAQQLSGAFEISNVRLKLYVEAFAKLKVGFLEVVIQKIPHVENQTADELAKLASSISPIVIEQPVEQVSLVAHINRMEGLTFPNDWRMAITEFLKSGATPSDQSEAYMLRRRAGRFVLIGDQLYKNAFSRPLLKCVGLEDVDYILQEVHQGS
ncbi:uncharacterized protein LOC122048857 [Zingiber officinale]|uniref:uncharacterized protein LOC122048857 n=1 Tax=Zingiber officinale TaxID=94328 RepID=UPI001C4D2210|nr:uncharacterized protein LOC122048857 [Zingiber officinale]